MTPTLLHLLHLASPALPVGAYAYSQGLEWAVDSGWLKTQSRNTDDLANWLTALLQTGLGHLDLPVLARCMHAWARQDTAELQQWNDLLRACRETRELLLEDEQLGLALGRLLNDLQLEGETALHIGKASYVTQFARACNHWQVPQQDALLTFAYSWLENQVAAATKLVPLGQTQAQKLLLQLIPGIAPVCERALQLQDDELGLSLPGLAMASAQHERQYSRLFRS